MNSRRNITVLFGLLALAGLGLGLGLGLGGSDDPGETAPAVESAAADGDVAAPADDSVAGSEPGAPGGAEPDGAVDLVKPTFDVVRISPSGDAVIAGRAAPGAEITVTLDGEKEVGTVRADERGEWVLLPSEPLPPGTHEFTLSSRLPDGAVLESDQAVVLVVPDPGKALVEGETGEQTMAVIVPREGEGASTVLQHPGEGAGAMTGVVLDTLDYDETGTLILSGRGRPGGSLRAYLDDEKIGEAPIGADGRWRIVREMTIAPGPHALRLEERGPDGTVVARSETPVSRIGPEDAAAVPGQSLLVVRPSDAQEPGAAMSVVLDTLDYDETGTLILSGRGRPGGSVRAYLDNDFIGSAPIGADGRWRIVPDNPLSPGLYTLRLDELGADGTVIARIETPLSRARQEETELAPGQALIVVQPGNSLWRIARRIYGGGVHYTLIFKANSDQIRDPDLIYPGQIFTLPQGG